MQGVIVRHERLGIGKIKEVVGHVLKVQFRGADGKPSVVQFGTGALRDGTLRRIVLSVGTPCLYGKELGKIKCVLGTSVDSPTLSRYELAVSDHESVAVSEIQIEPLPVQSNISPFDAVSELRFDSYSVFRKREALARSYQDLVSQGAGIRALLSSRVDLLPHQAYVAGVVLGDPVRRYILADEVGLGKTIEAGIIAHDLLIRNPQAKILVICPGALVQQWLCEIYSKFGGHVFRLIDRYSPKELRKSMFDRCIVSFTRTAFEIPKYMVERASEDPWDLVIVDEAHQLLASSVLYEVIKHISAATRSILLLSAIPAQKREDEFRQLLNLLEPDRYQQDTLSFKKLYEAQPQIGRRLRILERRLQGAEDGDFGTADVIEAATRISETNVVADDLQLRVLVCAVQNAASPHLLIEAGRALLHYVAEMYRINRRIIRNRRQALVEKEQIPRIERTFAPCPYTPNQAEIETLSSIDRLIRRIWQSEVAAVLKATATRVLYQSSVWPTTLVSVLEQFEDASPIDPSPAQLDVLRMGFSASYQEWRYYVATIASGLKTHLDTSLIKHAVRASRNWFDHGHSTRYQALVRLLVDRLTHGAVSKVIVFAGLDGLAQDLARGLRQDLQPIGSNTVAEFRHDLADEEKEKNAREFQTNPAVRVLISDESGGEGRNFQFADEIIHFDTPWFVARVEQRIGRLDRLGRDQGLPQVRSSVMFPAATTEAALVECFDHGFGVYKRSISGLEFALRDAEDTLAMVIGENGYEATDQLVIDLQKVASEERSKDESESVMDIASFDRARAVSMIADTPTTEARTLENCFVDYFRKVSAPKSFRDFSVDDARHRGWEFQADAVKLSNVIKELKGAPVQFRGTFDRRIAQVRPDLQFFCVGNPLFDAIIHSFRSDVTGRTYAISVTNPAANAWSGFEFIFSPRLSDGIDGAGYSLSFENKHVSVFIGTDGKTCPSAVELLLLRRAASGAQLTDLSSRPNAVVDNTVGPRQWQAFIGDICRLAREEAQRQIVEKIKPELHAERVRLTDLLLRLGPEAPTQYRSQHEDALRALDNWEVELDSIGFIVVNALQVNA